MNTRARLGLATLALAALLPAPGLRAQSALVVEHEGKMRPVVKVANGTTFIRVDDKFVPIRALRCGLVPVDEFLPVFVSIQELQVKTSSVNLVGSGSDINNEFHLTGRFESPFLLEDAFLVLELDTEELGKRIFYQDIGTLRPRESQWVRVDLALPEKLGSGKYHVHIFTRGFEVFHSQQPWQMREAKLDQMVMKRLAGAPDGPPKPFIGPVPEYPKALRKQGLKGQAVVRFHVTRRGVVTEPAVQSATDPALGEAALVAIRQWRFFPRIQGGKPVDTDAVMPFDFTPPVEKGGS